MYGVIRGSIFPVRLYIGVVLRLIIIIIVIIII